MKESEIARRAKKAETIRKKLDALERKREKLLGKYKKAARKLGEVPETQWRKWQRKHSNPKSVSYV